LRVREETHEARFIVDSDGDVKAFTEWLPVDSPELADAHAGQVQQGDGAASMVADA
jgi:hypothetical protein